MPDPVAPPPPRRGTDWADVLLPLGLIAGFVVLLQLNLSAPEEAERIVEQGPPLEVWLKTLVEYLAAATEIAAAVVIGVGVARCVWKYGARLAGHSSKHVDATEGIRLQLGRVLALGLELTLAADILQTAVAPSRQELLTLGAIVLLRTLLNIFLEREIREGEERRTGTRPAMTDMHAPA